MNKEDRNVDAVDLSERLSATASVRFLSRQLRFLQHIASAANASESMDSVVERAVSVILELDEIVGVGIYVVDEATRDLVLQAHSGLPAQFDEWMKRGSPSLLRSGVVSHRLMRIADIAEVPEAIRQHLDQTGVSVLGVVPIQHADRRVGVLVVAASDAKGLAMSTTTVLELVSPILGGAIATSLTTARLARSEEALRSFVESLRDLGFVVDPADTRILYATPSAERSLGYSPEEFRSMTVLDLHPPELRDDAARVLESMLTRHDVEYCRLPLMAKDGRFVPAESRVFRGIWDGKEVMFGLVRERTDRQCMHLVHEISGESLFRELLDHVPEGVYVRSPDGRITYANHELSVVHGIPASELVGRYAQDLLLAEDLTKLRAQGAFSRLADGRPVMGSARCRRPNGEIRHLEITAVPYPPCDEAQEVLGFVRDVTDREEALLRTVSSLTDIVHEARAPLTVIKGYTDLLRTEQGTALTDAERAKTLATISGSVTKLTAVLEDALEAERLNSARSRVHTMPVDLGALTRTVVEEHRVLAEQRSLRLEVVAPSGIMVQGDPFLLAKLLENILANAIKYSTDGCIFASVDTSDGMAQVVVRDEGIGISPDDLGHVFTRFYRSLHPHVRGQAGSGLGLHIAEDIARVHDGRIAIESRLGEGTTVSIELPPAPKQATAQPG